VINARGWRFAVPVNTTPRLISAVAAIHPAVRREISYIPAATAAAWKLSAVLLVCHAAGGVDASLDLRFAANIRAATRQGADQRKS